MKSIISPWLIYFASRADNLVTFFGVIAGICGSIAIGALFAGLAGYNEPFKFRKTISKSIIGCVVMTIITIMTPNTETIYTMAVVNEITPGRPQQLPYVSPPDKKTSQEKSGSNIVVEWMSAIKEIAENGYVLPSTNVHSKDEKFQRIIGMCNAVIMVLKED